MSFVYVAYTNNETLSLVYLLIHVASASSMVELNKSNIIIIIIIIIIIALQL